MKIRYPLYAIVVVTLLTGLAIQAGSEQGPDPRTYVGQESCMASGCHADAYAPESDYQGAEAFRQTMHQRVHLRPTPGTVVIDRLFEKDTVIKVANVQIRAPGKDTLEIRLSKSPDRRDYLIGMRFSGGGDSLPPMKVAYTYGGNGWIQRYLVEIAGSYYMAPFQYVLPGYRERQAYGGTFYFLDLNRWFEVSGATFEGEFFEWSTNRFRRQSWDRNCAQCHVNGFDIDRRITGTDTAWFAQWVGTRLSDSALSDQNINVGCESCHGPGSEHVANPTASNIISPGQFPRTFEGTDLRFDLCNQCHTRFVSTEGTHGYAYDEANRVPYIPGRPLKDYIRHPFDGMQTWADGITSYAHHQTGQDFMRSDVYRKHIFQNGCWSCHTVHTAGPNGLPYQLDRNWYSMNKGEGCLDFGCHESMGDTSLSAELGRMVNTHTQHSQVSSQCVNCHFTKTATIAFDEIPGRKPLREFSYHGFKVIRPVATIDYASKGVVGMLNTCAESCHRNGRGSRNFRDTMPAAPAFGTVDRNMITWKEPSDLALADSLWRGYQRIYARYLSAEPVSGTAPAAMKFTGVTPNPFRTETRISFTLPRAGDLNLAVHDMNGRVVRVLAAGWHQAGTYQERWDGSDEAGGSAPNGAYIIRARTKWGTITGKVLLER